MKEPRKTRPGAARSRRPRQDDEEPRPTRSRGPGAEELLELADELEEQGKALLGRARQLQRMAASLEPGERSPGPRAGRGAPAGGGGPRRGARPRAEGEERPRRPREGGGPGGEGGQGKPRKRDGSPGWTPTQRRRKP